MDENSTRKSDAKAEKKFQLNEDPNSTVKSAVKADLSELNSMKAQKRQKAKPVSKKQGTAADNELGA
jgi:hypothetical protein